MTTKKRKKKSAAKRKSRPRISYKARFIEVNKLHLASTAEIQKLSGELLDLKSNTRAYLSRNVAPGSLTKLEADELREQNERLRQDYDTLFQTISKQAKPTDPSLEFQVMGIKFAPLPFQVHAEVKRALLVLQERLVGPTPLKPVEAPLVPIDVATQVNALSMKVRNLERNQVDADALRTEWKGDIEEALRQQDPNN